MIYRELAELINVSIHRGFKFISLDNNARIINLEQITTITHDPSYNESIPFPDDPYIRIWLCGNDVIAGHRLSELKRAITKGKIND